MILSGKNGGPKSGEEFCGRISGDRHAVVKGEGDPEAIISRPDVGGAAGDLDRDFLPT